jgi:nucleoside-diphosphate-sugar epimerase
MKSLVLGKGFIGKAVATGLECTFGREMVSSVSARTLGLFDAQGSGDRLGDVCRSLFLDRRPEVLFIPAAITRMIANDFAAFNKNVALIKAIIQYIPLSVRQIVFFSTIDVYGIKPKESPITENCAIEPDDFYALSKVEGEFALRKFCQQTGRILTIFRLAGVFGPEDDGKSTINALYRSATTKAEIILTDRGEVLRDFVPISYLVDLSVSAAKNKVGGIFNLATGESQTLGTYAAWVANSVRLAPRISFIESNNPNRVGSLQFDVARLRASFSDIQIPNVEKEIGYYCRKFAAH